MCRSGLIIHEGTRTLCPLRINSCPSSYWCISTPPKRGKKKSLAMQMQYLLGEDGRVAVTCGTDEYASFVSAVCRALALDILQSDCPLLGRFDEVSVLSKTTCSNDAVDATATATTTRKKTMSFQINANVSECIMSSINILKNQIYGARQSHKIKES